MWGTLDVILQQLNCAAFVSLAELRDAVEEILPALKEKGITVYLLSDECTTEGIQCIGQAIAEASDEPLPPSLRSNIRIRSTALYIYTSGTTGTCQVGYVMFIVIFDSIACLIGLIPLVNAKIR